MNFLFSKNRIVCRKNPSLYIDNSPISNKGVFSVAEYKKGNLIEECPIIIFEEDQSLQLKNTILYWSYFIVQAAPKKVALALGFGSVYNHQCPANASFSFDRKRELLVIRAAEDIPAGAEITINYNGDPKDTKPVKFHP